MLLKKHKVMCLIIIIVFAYYGIFHLLYSKSISLDKIYLINLDKSTQRYQNMQQHLESVDALKSYQRFSATDGRNVIFTNFATGDVYTGQDIFKDKIKLDGDYEALCNQDTKVRLTGLNQPGYNKRIPGEVGVACSHKRIWQEIVKKGYQNTLIMEDDEKFMPFGGLFLTAAMHNVPKDFELLYLHHASMGYVYIDNIQDHPLYNKFLFYYHKYFQNLFWKKAKRNIISARAYILTPEAASKLLQCEDEYSQQNFMSIDIVMMKCIEDKSIITYLSKPMFVVNNEEVDKNSEINNLEKE